MDPQASFLDPFGSFGVPFGSPLGPDGVHDLGFRSILEPTVLVLVALPTTVCAHGDLIPSGRTFSFLATAALLAALLSFASLSGGTSSRRTITSMLLLAQLFVELIVGRCLPEIHHQILEINRGLDEMDDES